MKMNEEDFELAEKNSGYYEADIHPDLQPDNPPCRPTRAIISLDNFLENYHNIVKRAGEGIKIIGVVKADAYGHGFDLIELMQEEGVDCLAVAMIDEAIALRQKGIDRVPILILGHTPEDRIPELVEWDIIPAVFTEEFARALSDYCEKEGCRADIHAKIETGMGRIGFDWHTAADSIEKLTQMPGIRVAGMFTHFATADCADKTYTHEQLARYAAVVKQLADKGIDIPFKHVENSAALMDFDKTVFDGVRPGIILYGLYPSDEVKKENLPLKPVMTFVTEISHIKTLHEGESVGYGRAWKADGDRRIATLPVGYADGWSRILSGKGTEVLIRGKRAPVVGNICMDQCMVDITDIPEAELGDQVELFGEHISADEVAARMGTINYEVVCMVNKRVPRVYRFMGDERVENEILNDGWCGV
ncbi:MAG: alanine racemase [Eubacteriaceae bacterium]|jgi:alanine racemase